jgi:hypothetical protein
LVNRHVARSTAAHAAAHAEDRATDPTTIVLVDDRTMTTGGTAPPASGSQAGGSGAPKDPLMRPGTRPVDNQQPLNSGNLASSGGYNLYQNYYPDYVYPQYPQFGFPPSGQNPAQYGSYGQPFRPHSAPPATPSSGFNSSQMQPSGFNSSQMQPSGSVLQSSGGSGGGSGLLPSSGELNLFGNSQTATQIGSSMLGAGGSASAPPLQPPAPDVPPPQMDLNDTHLDIINDNINQDNFSQE